MKGCPNFTQCPSSPSVRPSSPSTADTVSKRRRTRVSMMAAISLQALFVPCSILRPHIHLETQQEFLNHAANIFVAIQQKRPSLETFSHFFAGFAVADLNVATRSHTISDVRNGAIPFLPFLERGGKGGGERRDRARGRVPSTIWGGASKIATLLLL